MEYEDYKRAKQLQEETLPAFERKMLSKSLIIVKSKVYEKSIFSYTTSIIICSLQK